jgi:DNA-binding NtrC family response regulator
MNKPVILLVDDETDLLDVMGITLEMHMPTFEIQLASSIAQAMRIVDTLDQDGRELALAVVDHVMGGETGLEFMQILTHRYPDLPKLMFTGQALRSVEEKAKAIGARVLWKPAPLSRFVGEVQEMLGV